MFLVVFIEHVQCGSYTKLSFIEYMYIQVCTVATVLHVYIMCGMYTNVSC